jgi:hypothetical protein
MMATITTRKTVTFANPFTLSDVVGRQPAGQYEVVTVEESVDSLSFATNWRRNTFLHSCGANTVRVSVSPVELDAALMRDAGWTVLPAPNGR